MAYERIKLARLYGVSHYEVSEAKEIVDEQKTAYDNRSAEQIESEELLSILRKELKNEDFTMAKQILTTLYDLDFLPRNKLKTMFEHIKTVEHEKIQEKNCSAGGFSGWMRGGWDCFNRKSYWANSQGLVIAGAVLAAGTTVAVKKVAEFEAKYPTLANEYKQNYKAEQQQVKQCKAIIKSCIAQCEGVARKYAGQGEINRDLFGGPRDKCENKCKDIDC